jgi:hypothetical protein
MIGEKIKSRTGGLEHPPCPVEDVQNNMTSGQNGTVATSMDHEPALPITFDLDRTQNEEIDLMFNEFLNSNVFNSGSGIDTSSNALIDPGMDNSTAFSSSVVLEPRRGDRSLKGSSGLGLNTDFDSFFAPFSASCSDVSNMNLMLDSSATRPYNGHIEIQDTSSKSALSFSEDGYSIPSQYSCLRGKRLVGDSLASGLVRHLRLAETKENMSLVKTAIARGHNIRDVFLAGLAELGKEGQPRPVPLPDAYKNAMSLVQMTTLEAYMSIGGIMGFTTHEMQSDMFKTKFYSPEALASGNFDAIIALSKGIPHHLQPTMAQIMYPHPPWIDFVPIPTLRQSIIMQLLVDPPTIDIHELSMYLSLLELYPAHPKPTLSDPEESTESSANIH